MLMVPTFATMPSLPQPAPKALWGVHYDQLTEEEKFWACYTENSAVMCGYRSNVNRCSTTAPFWKILEGQC